MECFHSASSDIKMVGHISYHRASKS